MFVTISLLAVRVRPHSGSRYQRIADRAPISRTALCCTPLAESAEEGPHVVNQKLGVFHRGKVAALVEFCPMHDVVVALCQTPDSNVLTGGDSHAGRHRSALSGREQTRVVVRLIVEVGRRAS